MYYQKNTLDSNIETQTQKEFQSFQISHEPSVAPIIITDHIDDTKKNFSRDDSEYWGGMSIEKDDRQVNIQREYQSPKSSSISNIQATRAEEDFFCDGREYCGQMHSRAEAEFFTRNCPNAKMDGDNDGVPCERDSRF